MVTVVNIPAAKKQHVGVASAEHLAVASFPLKSFSADLFVSNAQKSCSFVLHLHLLCEDFASRSHP